MIQLEHSEEHVELAGLTRSIADEVIAPAARNAEEAGAVPEDVWRTLFETGLTTPVDEEYGGGGVPDPLSLLTVAENFAHGDPGIALAALWHAQSALVVGAHGTDDQRRDVLPRLASDAGARASIALHEGFGRGPREYETTVEVDGDQVRVRGRKVGVPFATTAQTIVVIGTEPGTGAVRAVLVDPVSPGVEASQGPGNLALDATQLGTLDLDVTLPVTQLLGGVDADAAALEATVQRMRLLTAASTLGVAERAVRYAGDYATTRVAFGKPIAAYQGVSFPLAEAVMRIVAARAELVDVTNAVVEDPAADHTTAVAEAVAYAHVVGTQSARDAVQTLGGHGFIKDHPVELWYRATTTLSALDFDPLRAPFQSRL